MSALLHARFPMCTDMQLKLFCAHEFLFAKNHEKMKIVASCTSILQATKAIFLYILNNDFLPNNFLSYMSYVFSIFRYFEVTSMNLSTV